jgi:hypothetical protein
MPHKHLGCVEICVFWPANDSSAVNWLCRALPVNPMGSGRGVHLTLCPIIENQKLLEVSPFKIRKRENNQIIFLKVLMC